MRDQLQATLVAAMKAHDKRRIATVRLIQAAIKDRDIASREHGKDRIGDAEIVDVLTRMVKQRNDSVRLYEEGGRIDLADQEREEIAIITEFLPRQMTEDEMAAKARAVVEEIGAAGLKDMGRTMNLLKERFAGQMDFAKASVIVKGLLK
jgi:hypothetical protein